MDQVKGALDETLNLFWRGLAFILGGISYVEAWLRGFLQQMGLPPGVQTVLLILAALALFVIAFKALGGILRLLVIVFLVLLVVQLLGPLGNGVRRFGLNGPAVAGYVG